MKIHIQAILLVIFIKKALTDFDCTDQKNLPGQCSTELSCTYEEAFKERKGFSRYCRCKTVIHDLPLPQNILTYSMFRKICTTKEDDLKQLWINDADFEQIDSEILGKYPNLKYVNLANNNIRLNFSEKADKITELDVSYNKLTEIKDDALKHLKALKMLNVSFNCVSNVKFCFKELTELEEIYLNNNCLTKISNNSFDSLHKLRVLNLAQNYLTSIDSKLDLNNLQELYLNNNKLKSINEQEIISLPNLRILKINDNLFTRLGDQYLFENLQELHAENNQITSINKNVLSKLQNLKVFNISNNKIKIVEALTFSSRNNLQVVDLSSNNIESVDANNFRNFKNVSVLNFDNNSLTAEVISCENLQNLGRLKVLQLSHNQISKFYDCTFSKLENLSKLTLLANQLEKIPPSAFSALSKLQELDLALNQISDIPAGAFDNLGELRKLNISYNNLTRFDLNSLNNNPKLTSFDIKKNHLKNLDLKLLKNKLPSVKNLDLDSYLVECDLYGEVLKYFEENNVIFESCSGDNICCVKRGFSGKTILIVVGAIIVCIFVIIGIACSFRKCCRPKREQVLHIVPIPQN